MLPNTVVWEVDNRRYLNNVQHRGENNVPLAEIVQFHVNGFATSAQSLKLMIKAASGDHGM